MLHDAKGKVMQFGVSSPTLVGVTGNLKHCGHFQPPPPIPDRVKTRTRHFNDLFVIFYVRL